MRKTCIPNTRSSLPEKETGVAEERNIRGKVAAIGIGETKYYKRGGSPDSEFKMCLEAIVAAADDAGIKVTDIDGFASYSNDRNDPPRLASALGLPDLRF